MTFSIVARDPKTGALGVAAATSGPAVGALVPHARAGVGAIATQAMTNPYLALEGLEALANDPAEAVLHRVLARDSGRDQRQIIIVDNAGRTAGWTGPDCGAFAAHLLAPDVAVAGNLIAGRAVLEAMLERFATAQASQAPTLGDRLLLALEAGQAAGGDARGTTSSALKVYTSEAYAEIDLRVDLAVDPIGALATLLEATRGPDYDTFFRQVPRRHPA